MATRRCDLPGYHILREVLERPETACFKAVRAGDRLPVLLKLLDPAQATPVRLSRFRHEYEAMRNVDSPNVLKAYALEPCEGSLCLVLEDNDAMPLSHWMATWQRAGTDAFPIQKFLTLAIAVVDGVAAIHGADVVHRGLSPSSIALSAGGVKIVGFETATTRSREIPSDTSAGALEGSLAYLSPEQTGRMNRTVDYRTDFYSLGVTFYELLTGRRPFQATDPMELVHAHLARTPPAPHRLNAAVPDALSEIVLKLMAKAPEDRYQSARGLRQDLSFCLQRWQAHASIPRFDLGREDRPEHFLIPEKLYGRTSEVGALLAAFERVSAGATELFLVSGAAGIGKTAVVREVHEPIARHRGFFVQGKFEQLKRDIPLSAFVAALRDLVPELLGVGELQQEQWRQAIRAAVGDSGQVLVEVVPELEWIIGPQPPAAELPAMAAGDRFRLLFHRLITLFAAPEHPLVIFLDDLHSADSGSLALLQELVAGPGVRNLLLIGAYRDTELPAAHPLHRVLSAVEQWGAGVTRVSLSPLRFADVNALVAEALGCTPRKALSLTRLLYRITEGNPFYGNQLLKSLHDEGLITFDEAAGSWQCDLAQAGALALADDVVEFLASRLLKLPAVTQEIVKLAACVGSTFDLDTLAVVCERSGVDVSADLWPALAVGLVVPHGGALRDYGASITTVPEALEAAGRPGYRFVHDRVLQAAYSLIPTGQRQATHLHVARLLARKAGSRTENVFELVNHFNRALPLIEDAVERHQVASLNVEAGRKAKAAAAFQAAWDYFTIARGLLPDDSWQTDYGFTLGVHESCVEAAYLSGRFDAMEELASVVLAHARTPLDQVKVIEVKSQALAAQTRLVEAVESGLRVLELLGIAIPRNPTAEDLTHGLERTRSAYRGRAISDLADLPAMTDPTRLACMRILASILPVAFLLDPALYTIIVLKHVDLSIEYGNTPAAAFGYASYGLILCGKEGDVEAGYQFGQLGLDVVQRLGAKEWHCKVTAVVHSFISHWKRSVADTLVPLRSAYQSGLEVGDFQFAGYSAVLHCAFAYFAGLGTMLPELQEEALGLADAISQVKQTTARHYLDMLLQALHNLRESGPSPRLAGEYYDEESMAPLHREARDWMALFYLTLHRLLLHYLWGETHQAVADADEVAQHASNARGFPFVAIFHFFDSLTRLAAYRQGNGENAEDLWRRIEANQEKLKTWARFGPMNCLHKYHLVEAERLRTLSEHEKALEEYDRAIDEAKKNGYVRDEALANELAAACCADRGRGTAARAYLREAYEGYRRWGATAKAAHLQRCYPGLLPGPAGQASAPASSGAAESSVRSPAVSLDLATVVKASHAVSSEIDLARLLEKMMRIVIENAGAQRGALILERNGRWVIAAQGNVDEPAISVLEGGDLATSDVVSAAIVEHVARTAASVVLDDATTAGPFTRDPHVVMHAVRSVICSPLVNQGRPSGIVYLENNRATHAFPADRLELLNLLSGQMALSLDNARLHQKVQQELAERRQAEAALRTSEQRFRTIFDSVNEGILVHDAVTGEIRDVSRAVCSMYGYTREEVLRLRVEDLLAPEVPDSHPDALTWIRAAAGEEQLVEWRARTKEGRVFWVEGNVRRAVLDGAERLIVVVRDISDRKRSEVQLRQALKMESVGRLAGGVAHDFNNMLSVILGHTELALNGLDRGDPLYADLTAVRQAAERSAQLTRQLLAFARKQTVAPKVLNVNETLEGMLKMLHRLIGENIRLDWRPRTGLWRIRVDPSQLDQILANLCVNARDAIADVGTITIEVDNVTLDEEYCATHPGSIAGQFVRLSVSDTGCGMDKETLAHIFEPFFTTKGVGTGTGLGLATVYGAVQQNNGFINVYSEPGSGTTFTVYLPRHVGRSGQLRARTESTAPRTGHETILLVEDEPAILNVGKMMLERLGYRVIPAGTPGQAIEVARECAEQIDLLITDVIMPEMNGRDLAKNLLSLNPRLKRLFTSGYTANVIAHHGVLDDGVFFIQKPFSLQDLAVKVREVLQGA